MSAKGNAEPYSFGNAGPYLWAIFFKIDVETNENETPWRSNHLCSGLCGCRRRIDGFVPSELLRSRLWPILSVVPPWLGQYSFA